MMYYYLKEIDKAMYYHNRMMNGETEKKTLAKNLNLESLNKPMRFVKIKRRMLQSTIFQQYKDQSKYYCLLHEDKKERKKLEYKLSKILRKQLLISPKYEDANIRDHLMIKALHEIIEQPNGSSQVDALQELSKDFITTTERFRYTIAPLEFQYQLERQKKALCSNAKVVSMTNKMLKDKLRRSHLDSVTRYVNANRRRIKTADMSAYRKNARRGNSLDTSEPLKGFPSLTLAGIFSFSHLGSSRTVRSSKQAFNLTKLLDAYGKYLLSTCCEYAKEKYGSEDYVKELAGVAAL
eukprot:TRINITY_DN3599_c0_g2_i3.p1 TRINITY_DN3599_c0_g2~~TRINITY_DN3599_c0_g2_i3.p1  ORF type:complete len:294 (+),score=54.66 TRINITY_DN3599_c0_g2_i3:303-1184(+)